MAYIITISIITLFAFIIYLSNQPRDIRIIQTKAGNYRIQVRNNIFKWIWQTASNDHDDYIKFHGEKYFEDSPNLHYLEAKVQRHLQLTKRDKENNELEKVVHLYTHKPQPTQEKLDLVSLADNEEEKELLQRIQRRM